MGANIAAPPIPDSIAVVDVLSVQTKTDMDGRQSKRIDVGIINHLYGKTPENNISLQSNESAPGHELILRYERHLEGRFLLFSRWFRIPGDTGEEVGHHFHLSPASEALLAEVKKRVQLRLDEEEKANDAK